MSASGSLSSWKRRLLLRLPVQQRELRVLFGIPLLPLLRRGIEQLVLRVERVRCSLGGYPPTQARGQRTWDVLGLCDFTEVLSGLALQEALW